jgi:hypothetical protein
MKGNTDQILEDDSDLDEDFEDDEYMDDIDNDYNGYEPIHTPEKLFKTEKVKKDLSEIDPKRFEDADI